MTVLFVNACVRNEESRTLVLCREYLEGIEDVKEVNLATLRLQPFYGEDVTARSDLAAAGKFDDPIFDLAKEFAAADEIVIGSPYWDLSFPSVLKIYLEHCSVMDITFHYTEDSRCEGLSKAKHITYITTCGGKVAGANLGYEYFQGIAKMFGIPETRFVAAEDLDVVGINIQAQMDKARTCIRQLKASR